MKKILKSLLVLSLVLTTVAGTTKAWFKSEVSAENQITTGTLAMGLATTEDGGGNDGYWIAYDNGNDVHNSFNTMPAVTNLQPGDSAERYVAVVNRGSLPFDYRVTGIGQWEEHQGFWNTDPFLMEVSSVTRFNKCHADVECLDLYNWLKDDRGYDYLGGIWKSWSGVTGSFGHGTHGSGFTLQPGQFSIYKVELTLDSTAGNKYQNESYVYDIIGQAKQTTSTVWTE